MCKMKKNQTHKRENPQETLDPIKDLYFEYKDQIYGFAYKNLKSHTLSNDILQEVFLVLCQKDLSEVNNVRSFIFQITQNKVVDHIRKHAKNKSLRDKLWLVIEKKQKSVDQVIIEKEYFEHLQKAKSLLTPQQQLVFELSREKGLSHREIAQKLNLSQNTVKNHMVSGLKILREYLQIHSDIVIPILLLIAAFP